MVCFFPIVEVTVHGILYLTFLGVNREFNVPTIVDLIVITTIRFTEQLNQLVITGTDVTEHM